ncbi:FAD-binding protein [Prescottella equi]|jgi:3-oxosteroid 1-dehydrogenase|uniref:3-oxosteroid 1-dehydrogenase n=1 Tax=Rhodococcus hoagii TaxID=43767 RepID=A0A9Q2Z2H7_RHOHA|nr:FAD-binding protein [Prescottella equi]MCD7051525.1 FAD-dependent oxidoreductase [Rhodococcus sp. BH2-1]ERN45078.1 3-ketosteroid-delta-1-dehydrogenase [Prescottella equi NBRC 101255 = C 7]MBM4489147.1 FAD-dependent oxidoreductase [Prescottella equi]MBM4498580.1 FAD-dependent oxidoreductase [Prescottella equi]MBM4507158.1 FAD-dependent oxidoreductase [Prescottella equi]
MAATEPNPTEKPGQSHWDHEVDLLVVGSGAGGFTAALAGAAEGLDTLLIEKSDVYGGATALSGGGVWVPNNPLLIREGLGDSRADVRRYLDAVLGDRVPSANVDAFIDEGPKTLEFLETSSPHMRFQWCTGYSDYHPEQPGGRPAGRTIEPLPVDLRKLGADEHLLRPAALATPPGLFITSKDFVQLNMVMRTWRAKLTALRTGFNAVKSILLRRHMDTLGRALIARLRLALKDAGVPLWLETPMQTLVTDETGAVIGLVAERGGRAVRIRARRGVVLATGGFEFNEDMRKTYLPEGGRDNFSAASKDNTGDGIVAGRSVGAAVDLMDDAWWMPSFQRPDGIVQVMVAERSVPRSVIVDQHGRRFTNEAAPYVTFVHDQLAGGHEPTWFVFDERAKKRYPIGGIMPGQKFPTSWIDGGLVVVADTVEELAHQIDVPVAGLTETLSRFNGFARNGKDEDFHRGESAYDNYYGDPSLPHPTLDVIDTAPYYALRMRAGDLGTKGGLVYNENGQVLRADGSVIDGLYATGNTSASVMGNDYAGAGATIGPAMVFGYIGARHAARSK